MSRLLNLLDPTDRNYYQIIQVLNKWANLEGHDKCWHHPEILTELCNILHIPIKDPPVLPSRSEFEDGCRCYADQLYPNTSLTNNNCRNSKSLSEIIEQNTNCNSLYQIYNGEYQQGFGSLKGYKYYLPLGDYPIINGRTDGWTTMFMICHGKPDFMVLLEEFKNYYIDFTRITETEFRLKFFKRYSKPLMEITS